MDTQRATGEVAAEKAPEAKVGPATFNENEIEVPYLDHKAQNGHSYLVDYYDLGDNYEVFDEEIGVIESFMQGKIKSGEIANTKKAVEREIKLIERLNNIKDEEREVVRIGVLAEYIKFLNSTKNIKKYGAGFTTS